jgi:hypothetical protein
MSAVIIDPKTSVNRRRADRRLFAIILAWLWLGVVAGFGFDISQSLRHTGLHYLPIVHFHAVIFVGWMLLFTYQFFLIGEGKAATHKRLGYALAGYVVLMVVVGVWTTYEVDAFRASHAGTGDPTFFIIATSTMVVFAVLSGAGLFMRKHRDAHKRLMLLATIYVTDAGFARLSPLVFVPIIHTPYLRILLISYFFTDLAMIAIGVYDWIVRRRFYRSYLIAMAFIGFAELFSTWMYVGSPSIHASVLRFLTH